MNLENIRPTDNKEEFEEYKKTRESFDAAQKEHDQFLIELAKLTGQKEKASQERISRIIPDFSEQPELRQAHQDVTQLLLIMENFFGIEPDIAQLPHILLANENSETSYFVPDDKNLRKEIRNIYQAKTKNQPNSININPDHFHKGYVYAEEIGHYLHDLMKPKNDIPLNMGDQIIVEEFLGRLSESLARDLTVETTLSELFNDSEREFANEKKLEADFKKISAHYDKLILLNKFYLENRNSFLDIVDQLAALSPELENIKERWLKDQNIEETADEIKKTVLKVFPEILPKLKKLESDSQANDDTKSLFQQILKNNFTNIRRLLNFINAPKNKELIDDFFNKQLVEINISNSLARQNLEGENSTIREYESYVDNLLNHIIGYASAEKFMEQNPDWQGQLKELFKMSSFELFELVSLSNDEINDWLGKKGGQEVEFKKMELTITQMGEDAKLLLG